VTDPAGFTLAPEVDELADAARRFARDVLAPAARDHETSRRWPDDVLAVLDGFALGSMDLRDGGGGGCLAKVVLLETLATGDAGGLPAADRPGPAAGAVDACPDRDRAAGIAAEGAALVVGPDPDRIAWAPAWPPLRWAWVSEGDTLRLVEVAAEPEPVEALAFAASGGVTAPLADAAVAGEWALPPGGGPAVRGRARLWAAAVALGVAQDALDATVAYTTERIVFGKPVAHHQANAFDLAALATRLHGSRLAVRDAASTFDAAGGTDPDAGFWASQAWLEATEAAVAITEAGIQLLGGHGFLVDHLAEKRFREARMLGLLAGGRDAALDDLAGAVLDVPDPLLDRVLSAEAVAIATASADKTPDEAPPR
jgi:alkylation response protein AidB-like acyl-CoA dehydrogenase